MIDNKILLESYDYKLVTRAEFEAATDRPDGLLERAAKLKGDYVVYDPLDDDCGWLLVGDDPDELAETTIRERVV